ncbi:hypothetical protein [Archangium lipolyticum]|uniref:hypothetical protein n=1 Tax=Archangium lipolyticum TaxID=2970465 RepID=UPI00214A1DD1|nr:hypothetical protein [Archangium lipolyticum]
MREREPVRLLEEGSEATPELRELLGAASLDEPSAEQLAGLAGKLGPLLGPAGGAATAGAATGTAAPAASGGLASVGATGLKLKVLVGVAGMALAGVSFQAGRDFEREHPRAPRVEREVSAPAPAPSATPAPEPVETPVAPSPETIAAPMPEPVEMPVAPSAKTSAVPAPRVSRPRAAGTPAPAAAGERASADEELTLLESAYQALQRGDAAEALAEADRHAERFPAGALAQEREVLAIDALVRMGRRAEAGTRAEAFRKRYPTSTHGVRIQNLLSGARP